MTTRPVFLPLAEGPPWVAASVLQFTWYSGLSVAQARRSIRSLHEAATRAGLPPILEISTKSELELGRALSAMNLRLILKGSELCVESAYQGSKVFGKSGPYWDLYCRSGREAKKDVRLASSGDLTGFRTPEGSYLLEPATAFYDWLYLRGLLHNPDLARHLEGYSAFSDIAFNPQKSFATQAHSAALYVAMIRCESVDLQRASLAWPYFVGLLTNARAISSEQKPTKPRQMRLGGL